jgi:aspartate-semialdehyde dehydrogenase
MALKPLLPFGIKQFHMVSLQAISGAGYPGVASLDILDNIVPYVSGDEDKMQTETLRMLGKLDGDVVRWLDATASASCNRVPIVDGHLINVSVALEQEPDFDAVIEAWDNEQADENIRQLPSAPDRPIQYLRQQDRPQIRRDRNAGQGMMTSIGRLWECPLLGYKFATLAHNTIRGAAGCSVLNAELLATQGYIENFNPTQEQIPTV